MSSFPKHDTPALGLEPLGSEPMSESVMLGVHMPSPRDRLKMRAPRQTIDVSYVCVDATAWGVGAQSKENLPATRAAWRKLYEAGINYIDTSPGRAENIVGELIKDVPRSSVVVQSKYASHETSVAPSDDLMRSLKESLARLGTGYVDIYLIQGPLHFDAIGSVARGLASCVKEGLVRSVGVADFDAEDLEVVDDELAMYNLPVTVYQMEGSTLEDGEELQRRLKTCESQEIAMQSHRGMDRLRDELAVSFLEEIAKKRNKSLAAVSLNQSMMDGVLPVVAVRDEDEAEDVLEAFGWRLDQDELDRIERMKP